MNKELEAVLQEVVTIRKLLVIAILNSPDMSQQKLAKKLGVNQSSISRMLSSRSVKSEGQ